MGPLMTADLLAAWRAHLGMTQTQLAEELGINQATIARWEQGRPISGARMVRRALQGIEREQAEQGAIAAPTSIARHVADQEGTLYQTALACPACGTSTPHTLLATVAGAHEVARWQCDVCGEHRYTGWATPHADLPALPRRATQPGRYRRDRPTDLRRKERRAALQGHETP